MPVAVWYFNKAQVYIKTHMPFSAEFHRYFEDVGELERINIIPDDLSQRERKHKSLKSENKIASLHDILRCYKVGPLLVAFFSFISLFLCCIKAIKALHGSVKVPLLDHL